MDLNDSSPSNCSELIISDVILSTVLAPLFLSIYIFVLIVIIVEWKHFKNPYYSLTVGLGLCHLMMLIRFIYTFIISYHNGYVLGETFDSIMAALAWSVGWHSVVTYQIFISMNRFAAIFFFSTYQDVFSPKVTRAMVLFAYVSGFLSVGPLLISGYRMNYDFRLKMNGFKPEDGSTEWFYFFDVIFVCSAAFTIMVLYVVAISMTKYKLKRIFTRSNRSGFVKEVKLMAQGFLVAVTLICQEFNFYMKWNSTVTLTFMLLHSGTAPLIYLAFDQKLRKYVRAYCTCNFRKDFKTDSTVRRSTERQSLQPSTTLF